MRVAIVLTLGVLLSTSVKSQTCSVTVPSFSCTGGTTLDNNSNITSGQTFTYNGTGSTFTGVQVNGGTLVLCGTGTLSNLAFNSGTIIINTGANITFTGSGTFNGSGNNFYNLGIATFGLSVSVQPSGVVYNGPGASITITGDLTVINSGHLVNEGSVTANEIDINTGASICLGPNSSSNVVTILNNTGTNPVTFSGTGKACISYGNSFTGTGPLTSSSNIIICVPAGASPPTPVVIGSATVQNPCVSCNVALPVTLVSFKGMNNGTQAELEWVTALEENLKSFAVERSNDGQNFKVIDTIAANDRPSTYKFSTRIDVNSYFRLKMIDEDGKFTYSQVILMEVPTSDVHLSILSNPTLQSYIPISVYVPGNQSGELRVIDNLGRSLKRKQVSLIKGSNNLQIDLNGISAGHYYLYFIGASEKSQSLPFIKL